jgi:hypothetical protein
MRIYLAILILAVGCTGSAVDHPMCEAGALYCASASELARCTLTGSDAVVVRDCGAGAECATSGCAEGAAACCRSSKPRAHWEMTSPAVTGEAFDGRPVDGVTVHAVAGCGAGGIGLSYATLDRPLSRCPSDALNIRAQFDQVLIGVGETLALPNFGANLYATIGGRLCSSWTGTMRLDSDLPNWSVSIDATCTEAGSEGLRVAGVISGSGP